MVKKLYLNGQKTLPKLVKKLPSTNKISVNEVVPGSNAVLRVPPPPWLLNSDYWSDSGAWNDIDDWND